jgi:hypothetical protein
MWVKPINERASTHCNQRSDVPFAAATQSWTPCSGRFQGRRPGPHRHQHHQHLSPPHAAPLVTAAMIPRRRHRDPYVPVQREALPIKPTRQVLVLMPAGELLHKARVQAAGGWCRRQRPQSARIPFSNLSTLTGGNNSSRCPAQHHSRNCNTASHSFPGGSSSSSHCNSLSHHGVRTRRNRALAGRPEHRSHHQVQQGLAGLPALWTRPLA